ncbi:hypothetical protein [Haloarcula onubensis]|uniref:Restriction endonuclease type IV Mrr domain-containing protein n=1 Tax=Haloarcula onubensis TaxID=2950539 RepID=A0ABU2FS95_9EURY|nr:hypothetical protein [Halomicroarcula sp. S3CR25-11]MDS0283026.1 hypothetical protein [Halomicroarcula sp. S3CR25-11]
MGRIINLNSWDGEELPGVLSRTGGGGFLSTGYLADDPAIALVEDDETMQYVLTNRKRGVTVESADETSQVRPDSNHRTVVVVTDRRLLVLVGRDDGDEQHSIDLSEVTGAASTAGRRNGQLSVDRDDGTTWEIPTGTDGLDAVVAYLREAAAAWREVEASLATVERRLSDATRREDDGEYDRALSAARETHEDIEAARSRAVGFSRDHPGNALHERTQAVVARRVATLGAIRVARAREATATGDRLFRAGNYEGAREAFERAREEYDAALTESERRLDDPGAIRAEHDRVDRLVADIDESPLPAAITADRAAVATDDPAEAAAHWESALSGYRLALEAAEGDGDSLYRGDPGQLGDRITTVAESLAAAQRTVGEEARRAGDWYADAQQYEAALEEFATAAEAFDAALATARESYPDAVPHLEADVDALQRRIDRARASRDGEDPGADRIESDDEPTYEVSATLGEVEGPTAIADAIEPRTDDSGPESTVERLERLDAAGVADVVADALTATGWETQAASPRTPFELLATRGDDRMGVVVRNGDAADAVTECAAVTGAAGTDTVLLATNAAATADLERRASERDVRLIDSASLAAVVESQRLTLPAPVR